VEYVGAAYAGFQRQPGKMTVQGTVERAIEAVVGEPVRVDGSGRTDAGAHAAAQVIAFSTESGLSPAVLGRAINAHLPRDIAVTQVEEAAPGFHPRHDAQSRVYRYLIWNRPVRSPFWQGRAAHVSFPLDVQRMHQALQQIVGRRDFGAFVAANAHGSRTRTLYHASCRREGDLVIVELEADGFLKQMVRAIVGTLIRVGGGRLDLPDFRRVADSGDRAQAGPTAPAEGLYLAGVNYGYSTEQTSGEPARSGGGRGRREETA
jgi:tRNA pseudouridine38-40 synthase